MKKQNNHATKNRFSPLTIFLLVILVLYVLVLAFMLYWMIVTASKDYATDYKLGNVLGFPSSFVLFSNIKIINGIFANHSLLAMAGYTLLYAVGCSLAKVVVTLVVAYLCSQYRNWFSKLTYNVVIITMIIPIVGSQAAEIQVARDLGLYGHIWGMWIMRANFLGLYFLIFYSVFKSMPASYYEASKIDGANDAQIMLNIAFPLVKYTFLTILLLVFIEYWNDYLTPNIYLQDYPTLSLALYWQSQGQELVSTYKRTAQRAPLLMTSALVISLPVIILFAVFNKRLMGNLSVGGIKG